MPSKLDSDAFEKMSEADLDPSKFPHVFAWYMLMSYFDEGVRKSWGPPSSSAQPQQQQEGGSKKGDKKEKKEKGEGGGGGKDARALAKQKRLEER